MKKVLVIEGMHTWQMGTAVVRIFEGLSGVDKATLHLDKATVTVEYIRGVLTEDALCDAVNEEGFEVVDIYDD